MKKLLMSLVLAALPGGAFAAGFGDLAVSASQLKARAAALPEEITPTQAKDPGASAAAKEWTVMVFMNAKNDLGTGTGVIGKTAENDLAEMKKIGTTPAVNVVVELGIIGKGSRRMLIQRDGEAVFGNYPDADMGDYRRVIDFIKWAKTAYPAKRYMLVLWNHGLGWIDPPVQKAPSDKGILFDDETKNYVRTKQLGEILRQTGYVDVLTMNACLMQTAEVAYEVKDNTGLILGSEETMVATGFDYEKLLGFMNAAPGFTNGQLSDFIMKWYRDYYETTIQIGELTIPLSSVAATLSTVRPGALNDLPAHLDAFASAVMRNNETEAVKKGVETAVRFTSLLVGLDKKKILAPNVDLYDFTAVVGANAVSPETKHAAESLKGFVKDKLVMAQTGMHMDQQNGYDYSKTGGISIYMTMKVKPHPNGLSDFTDSYAGLSLSQNSQWDEFVSWCDGVWLE